MKRIALAFLLLAAPGVSAQQPQQQPSASEQALGEKLMQEIQASVSARAQCIDLQRQLDAAKARIKELEPKEPAGPPK